MTNIYKVECHFSIILFVSVSLDHKRSIIYAEIFLDFVGAASSITCLVLEISSTQ